MAKGLERVGRKFRVSFGVPKDVREHFDGIKKKATMLHTNDEREAERLADEAHREFWSRVMDLRQAALNGERILPQRIDQIVGYLFGRLFAHLQASEFGIMDMSETVHALIAEAQDDGVPLFDRVGGEGAVFDDIVRKLETLLDYSEQGGYAVKRAPERPGATMNGAAKLWAVKAKHIPKTKSQYLKDVREFSTWFEQKRGHCYGARIRPRDVNDYVGYLMSKDAAKATIMRSLSACRLIYRSGQFSTSNPFSGVTDRMVIEGDKLKVRDFTDAEMQSLLKPGYDDWPAVMIAAYSGMRLSEISALKAKNVERAGKGYVFNLMNAGRRKTKAAYRKVPVHPVLLQKVIRGLLERLEPEAPLIGPDTTDSLSKRINRVIDSVATDPSVRAHSLRHTFISKLAEAGVRKELRMAIAGHEGSDAHDRYTHADFIVELAQQIGKVRYG